jgi:4-amino-4-deoxy-L-arabinose transferase-like glycosyltransferase
MNLQNRLNWLRTRMPECALLLLGLCLRLTMRWRYAPDWGFDAGGHFVYIDWILEHRAVPDPDAFFHAFHPPLFYALAAAIAGHSRTTAVWIAIVLGTLRLVVIWAGLEIYFHGRRWARLSALALVAVLPASVHVDGLVYGEAMSGFLVACAMLLTLLAFRQPARSRWRLTTLLGIVLGIALLTKISGAVILVGICAAAILEFVFAPHGDWQTRWKHLLPWASTLVMCFAVCGWYFVPIAKSYGRPFVTSFDTLQKDAVAESGKTPYLDRRRLGFLLGWDRAIYDLPYWPTAAGEHPRFFPLLMVSTFVDYYNFSYSGLRPDDPATSRANARPLTPRLLGFSRLSAVGGTFIALGTTVAFVACLYGELRKQRWGVVALLVGAALSILSALHFAIQFPSDSNGVIKGTYLQFGAPPLYAMFGVAVAWTQRKPWRWLLFALFLASLWLVASYTLYCRARLLMLPADWI